MNTFELSLDLDKSYTGEPVRLRQGDKRGTVIRATIYDHGEPFTGSYTARYVQAIAGTGNEYYRADATFAAGVATVTVNEEYAAAVAGNAYGYFQFVSGSTVIASTQSFPVIVLPDATAEAEVGERYDSAIEDALAELDEATGRISQMVQDATAEYLEAHPEITTTVQDNSLDDDKLIQKGGILQREQWLETMLPNIPRKATAEADVHSVTDSAGGGPLGITVYGRSTQDGTPTPDAPVAIQSVGPDSDGGVRLVCDDGYTWATTAHGAESGYLDASGSVVSSNWSHTAKIPFSGGRLLILTNALIVGNAPRTCFYDASGAFVSALQPNDTMMVTTPRGNIYSLPAPANAAFASISFVGGTILYAPLVTIPIDLGGRSLRSLPDGTRDEVNVDEWGHATLIQRVGSYTVTGEETAIQFAQLGTYSRLRITCLQGAQSATGSNGLYTHGPYVASWSNDSAHGYCAGNYVHVFAVGSTAAEVLAATAGAELVYPLAEPVTIDLGYLDPALLPAPDLTAYVVPSAPSVLRYGFDVAAAIAELATA